MSIRILSLIWERAPHQGGSLLTLLALADWSNDDGESWPSIPKLAVKARQSERNVRYILRDLEAEGLLRIVPSKGFHHPNHYHLSLETLQDLQPLQGSKETLQSLQPSEFGPLQNATARPATSDSKACKLQPASEDPSEDPEEIQTQRAYAPEEAEQNLASAGEAEESATAPAPTPTADHFVIHPTEFTEVIEMLEHRTIARGAPPPPDAAAQAELTRLRALLPLGEAAP